MLIFLPQFLKAVETEMREGETEGKKNEKWVTIASLVKIT
jgi:hypothetical protein